MITTALPGAEMPFPDLFHPAGLQRLDERFRAWLGERDAALPDRLNAYRQAGAMPPLAVSELLLALAPHLEDFIARLFAIEAEVAAARAATLRHDTVLA
nr:hypothetical protein [Pseudomonadota bacterium]